MEQRASSLAAGPEVASLNLAPDMSKFKLKERPAPLPYPRPALEIDECIAFTYGQIHQFAAEMKQRGIKPELELYHPGCSWVVRYLIENDLIEKTVLDADCDGVPNRKFSHGREHHPTLERISG
jgi:3-keto-5-aminohexanoate cleavage enzyme